MTIGDNIRTRLRDLDQYPALVELGFGQAVRANQVRVGFQRFSVLEYLRFKVSV
jgi:hypothetical protein